MPTAEYQLYISGAGPLGLHLDLRAIKQVYLLCCCSSNAQLLTTEEEALLYLTFGVHRF